MGTELFAPPALFLLKGKQRREQDYRTYLPLFQSVQVPYCYCSGRTQAEIQRYDRQYQHDTQQLKDLKTDSGAIARVARERYFMKADDEDIFVLSDDEQPAENTPKYETAE